MFEQSVTSFMCASKRPVVLQPRCRSANQGIETNISLDQPTITSFFAYLVSVIQPVWSFFDVTTAAVKVTETIILAINNSTKKEIIPQVTRIL